MYMWLCIHVHVAIYQHASGQVAVDPSAECGYALCACGCVLTCMWPCIDVHVAVYWHACCCVSLCTWLISMSTWMISTCTWLIPTCMWPCIYAPWLYIHVVMYPCAAFDYVLWATMQNFVIFYGLQHTILLRAMVHCVEWLTQCRITWTSFNPKRNGFRGVHHGPGEVKLDLTFEPKARDCRGLNWQILETCPDRCGASGPLRKSQRAGPTENQSTPRTLHGPGPETD